MPFSQISEMASSAVADTQVSPFKVIPRLELCANIACKANKLRVETSRQNVRQPSMADDRFHLYKMSPDRPSRVLLVHPTLRDYM